MLIVTLRTMLINVTHLSLHLLCYHRPYTFRRSPREAKKIRMHQMEARAKNIIIGLGTRPATHFFG